MRKNRRKYSFAVFLSVIAGVRGWPARLAGWGTDSHADVAERSHLSRCYRMARLRWWCPGGVNPRLV